MQGTIKKVISNKGYGFIDSESQDGDLFFHKSNLDSSMDFSNLQEGTAVEFEVSEGRRGPEATVIKLAGEGGGEEAPPTEEASEEETSEEE